MAEEAISEHPYALRAIYLKESRTRLGPGFDPTVGGNELIGEFRVLGGEAECRTLDSLTPDGTKETLRTCVFTTQYEFRYLWAGKIDPETQKPVVAAEITAYITTDYLCNTPDFPLEADLHRWGQSNVLLHAWPYWREFCHTTLARMHLPVTLMPLAGMIPTAAPTPEKPGETKRRRKKPKTT
ncbi:MAG: hypothetical protein KKG92_05695 [Gammaproteobacteria bacterium]|nr:hypothetical protein [Gammaproteobacteria bacterium]